MTAVAPPPVLQSRSLEGIACVVVSMTLFVGQDIMMKSLLALHPVWVLIAARGVMAVLILGPMVAVLGGPHRLWTPLWPLHLARAALFASGFAAFYAAFPFMPLAKISTIFFSAPLMIAAMAALWLGETIGPHRIGALVVGFFGVVVAMNPFGEAFDWIAVLPLFCAASYALSQILARRIGDRETTLTTGLFTVGFSGVLIVPTGWIVAHTLPLGPEFRHLSWDWSIASPGQVASLAALGALGMVAYMLASRAYQIASASLVAPFDYTYLPLAAVAAYLFWGEVPANTTLAGMAMIVAAGLYLGYRELVNRGDSTSALPVAESVVAPGNPVAPLSIMAEMPDAADAAGAAMDSGRPAG
ncbi:MAG: DMT family transporter [Paracoccaceae bacterium]